MAQNFRAKFVPKKPRQSRKTAPAPHATKGKLYCVCVLRSQLQRPVVIRTSLTKPERF